MEYLRSIKLLLSALGAWISIKLGILGPVLLVLTMVIVLDYLTGMLAAKYLGKWNSKTGIWGIVKKLMYGIAVVIGMTVDWLIVELARYIGVSISISTFFGLATALWLIINELISIGENLIKLESDAMPPFLKKAILYLKKIIEDRGEALADGIGKDNSKDN